MAPATVLVVDDDPVILKLLEVNFEMEGFSVVRAADGAEGLERAREVLPDIVILDVMMPRMTGYEVAKALREDEGTAHIPIIFVTARAQSSDVERGMELGVDDYVTKPFDPLDLIARVNVLLARRADAEGPAEAGPDTEGAAEAGPDTAGTPGDGVVAEGGPEGNGSAPGGPPTGPTPTGPAPGAEAPAVPGDTDRGDRSPL
jgi:DNA-binding response OmpR family regulator